MDGLKKIDFKLDQKQVANDQMTTSPRPARSSSKRLDFKKILRSRKVLVALAVVLFLFLFSIFGVFLPATKVYKDAKITYANAQAASWAMKTQNVTLASDQLAKTKTDLEKTQKDLEAMGYLKFVPVASWYYNDAYHITQAGSHGINAAIILIDSIKPYADVLGLKGQGSFVGGTAQQRIETAVKTIGKITPRIDDISNELAVVRSEIDMVDPSHYPTFLFGKKVRKT